MRWLLAVLALLVCGPAQANDGMGLGVQPGYCSTWITGVRWHSSPHTGFGVSRNTLREDARRRKENLGSKGSLMKLF